MITTKRPFSQNYRKTLLFIIGLFLLILKWYRQKVYPETYDSDSIIKTGIQFNDNGQYDKALAEYDIDKEQSFLVGDSKRDVEAAEAADVKGYLYTGGNLLGFVKNIVSERW